MAVIVRIQLYIFLLLTSLALQQSCGLKSALQHPNPEPVHEVSEAEPPGDKNMELSTAEQDREKPPEVSMPKETPPEPRLYSPAKEMASSRINYDTVLEKAAAAPIDSVWQYRKDGRGQIVGFEFSNRGGNQILPHRYEIAKNLLFTRDFQFRFDDRARQDIHLFISDWAPSRDKQFRLSELMNSVVHLFPRNYLPAIESSGGRTIVTLPTGEEVEFNAKTHEIVAGVFSEAPVDLNPDKAARKFPGINYTGKGVIVRANSRGKDPRFATTATITTGSPVSDCAKGAACYQCQVPSKELWDQNGAGRFRFSTDSEFDQYLLSRCGFGLPENIIPISRIRAATWQIKNDDSRREP